MKNFFKKIASILIPLILIFFLLQTITSNWHEVLIYLNNFQTIPFVASFLILLLIYPESAFAWYNLIKMLGVKISLQNALYIWVISNTSRYIPGAIWQYVGRVELGQQMGITRKDGILAVLYETLLIVASGCLISLFIVEYWNIVGIQSYIILLGTMIPFILIHPIISKKLLLILAKLTKKEQFSIIPLKMRDYVLVLPLFLVNFLINGLALTFLIYAFTGNFEIEKLFFVSGVYALSWLIGYFSIFAPGGLGVTEITLALLLSLQMPLSLASTIAIIYRFLLVIAELVTFIVTLKFKYSKRLL